MNVILAGIIFAVALSAGVLVLLEIGRHIGVRQLAEEGETASKGLGAIEVALTPEELSGIHSALENIRVADERYPRRIGEENDCEVRLPQKPG